MVPAQTQQTQTDFGDIRSALAQDDIQALRNAVQNYKGDVPPKSILQYIQSAKGYLPHAQWTHLHSPNSLSDYLLGAIKQSSQMPLRAVVFVGGDQHNVGYWKNPSLELHRAVLPYRRQLIEDLVSYFPHEQDMLYALKKYEEALAEGVVDCSVFRRWCKEDPHPHVLDIESSYTQHIFSSSIYHVCQAAVNHREGVSLLSLSAEITKYLLTGPNAVRY